MATVALEANCTCDLAQESSVCDRHLSADPILAVESICLIPWEPFKPSRKEGDYLETYLVS